jgi:hypothetical protein
MDKAKISPKSTAEKICPCGDSCWSCGAEKKFIECCANPVKNSIFCEKCRLIAHSELSDDK